MEFQEKSLIKTMKKDKRDSLVNKNAGELSPDANIYIAPPDYEILEETCRTFTVITQKKGIICKHEIS